MGKKLPRLVKFLRKHKHPHEVVGDNVIISLKEHLTITVPIIDDFTLLSEIIDDELGTIYNTWFEQEVQRARKQEYAVPYKEIGEFIESVIELYQELSNEIWHEDMWA